MKSSGEEETQTVSSLGSNSSTHARAVEIFCPLSDSTAALSALAIAIGGSIEQRHTGIVIRPANANKHYFVHLAWQNDLRRNDYPERSFARYCCIQNSSLDAALLEHLADWVHVVYSVNAGTGIPYGFNDWLDAFSISGEYKGAPGKGLTCATFVLAAFAAQEIILVNKDTWPKDRIQDHEDQFRIVGTLQDFDFQDQANAQLDVIFGTRIRPEEVAAAFFNYQGHAAEFQSIEPLAEQVLTLATEAGAFGDQQAG